MSTNNKGQAAIEFLITYGWAIMAAMMVIGALTYFGITNPATSMPDKCMFSNAFECKDYQITTDRLYLKVTNTAGQTIYADINAIMTENNIACAITGSPAYLDPEGEMEIICDNPPGSPFTSRDKAKVKVSIEYTTTPSGGFTHVSLGEVYATVQ